MGLLGCSPKCEQVENGKTRIALAYLLPRVKRMLVVAPLAAMDIWQREARALGYDGPIHLLNDESVVGRAAELHTVKDGIVVVNHDVYWMDAIRNAILEWKPPAVVIDEAQHICGRATRRSRFAHVFPHLDWVKYRLALTGTPMTNKRYEGLFSLYRFIDPTVFGTSFPQFEQRYCIKGGYMGYTTVGYRNEAEIKQKIIETAFQIAKSEALPDLPPVQDIIVPITLTATTRARYTAMAKDSLLKIETDVAKHGLVATAPITLTRIMRLQQITSGFITARSADGTTSEVVDLSQEKLDACTNLVAMAKENNERVVLVSRFLRDVTRLQELLKVPADHVITGDTSGKKKAQFERDHIAGTVPIAIGQIQSLAEGVDLDSASIGGYFAPDFRLIHFTQFKNRLHGQRQTRPAAYYHFVAKDTVDEQVYKDLQDDVDIGSRVLDLDYVRNLLSM